MKSKKLILVILLSTIIIIGSTIGTISWFTTKSKATSNLALTTGSLNIGIENDRWILQNKEASEVTNKDAKNDFNNVKPGDSFVKTVTLRNTGSLKQKLSFEINKDLPQNLNESFRVDIKNLENVLLMPNQTKDVSIKVSLKKGLATEKMQNNTVDFKAIDNINFIKVKAIQVNTPKNNIIKFLGYGNNMVASLKFDFSEGKIKATSTGNEAHYAFGGNEYIKVEIVNNKGESKVKTWIKGIDTANLFANALNNITFNTGDKIIIDAQELNRILISKDNGNVFQHFSLKGGHAATKVLTITNTGLE